MMVVATVSRVVALEVVIAVEETWMAWVQVAAIMVEMVAVMVAVMVVAL